MKLHVGNLPFSVTDEELKNLFADYNAEEVSLIKDKFSGRSKGFGFVTISDDEVANKAISELNGKDVGGREIKVSEAKPMEERPRRSFGGGDRGGDRGGFGGGRGRSFGPRRY
ncbi:RNA-binding protein [Candidatus Pacearchaeota archaeon]|jgi:RNA recognition motif-containing protein|nr:RNA-binding protein [Candidatus Pacearchaeota archaeon]